MNSDGIDVAATAPSIGEDLRYATVWEDAHVLRAGLQVQAGARVLSIAAAGDNALALLLDDPAEVVAVDVSRTQLALCALKTLCLRRLSTDELHHFCGFAPDTAASRRRTWHLLRGELAVEARAVFDARLADIEQGIVHAGKLERWFRVFSTRVLPLVQRRSTITALLSSTSLDEQRAIYREHFNHTGWRLLCRLFFSRTLMSRGRDAAFLRYVDDESVGATMLRRAERALTMQPLHEAMFATWLLTGGPSTRALPLWAQAEYRDVLVERLPRIRWVHGDVRQVAAREGRHRPFAAMNLSDVFEYMSTDDARATWRTLAGVGTHTARLLWWLLLVDRRPTDTDPLQVDEALSAALWARDAGFFYGGVVVAQPR